MLTKGVGTMREDRRWQNATENRRALTCIEHGLLERPRSAALDQLVP